MILEEYDMELNISVLQKTLLERKIFRAYDIRGHLDILTPMLIRKIGFALGRMMRQAQQTVAVVGYDARLSSPSYAELMSESLQACGLDVIQIGCVSSPVLYFTAAQYGGNGVMITASHNAITDNGVKWLIQGLPPTPEQIQSVADYIEQDHHVFEQGSIRTLDPLAGYFCYLEQDIQLEQKFTVSLDGFHGSAGGIAQQALAQLGCTVQALNCQADGDFPLGAPDPSDVQRLQLLKQSVIDSKSAVGIALDGDGDRLVVLDEHGQLISPDRLMSLFTKICLAAHPHKEVVCDVKCSNLIAKTAHQYRGHLKMIRTGSSFLRNYLAASKGQAVFGGEFAGHYVFNDGRGKGFDDGLYVALRLLEYMSQQGQTLSELLVEFPERVATGDVYIHSDDADHAQIIDLLVQNPPKTAQISMVDGLRLDFPFGFGIIRPSNTGEYFTVRFDADNQQHFEQIRQYFIRSLLSDYPAIAQAMAVAH